MVDAVTPDQYSAGGVAEQLNAAVGALKGQGGGSFAASQIAITAGATRTQAGAYQLSSQYSRVDTSTAHSATTGLGDGVALPLAASLAGSFFVLHNNTSNIIQVYTSAAGSDTLNGQTGSIGVAQAPNSVEIYYVTAASTWQVGASRKFASFKTNTATGDATLAAANISGGSASVDLAMTGALAAGGALTLPTVANLAATLPGLTIGHSYRLRICNQSSNNFAWTVTTNTGWTVTGTATIAQNTWREFVITFTSLTAATIQNVAIGTFS